MAYDSTTPIVFDLETIAHPEAAAYLPPPDVENLIPPKNYTNVETIEKWKVEEKARRLKAWEDDLAKCALDADLNRIIALGFVTDGDVEVALAPDEHVEAEVLHEFWSHVPVGSTLMGFNVVGFDMPTLLRRSKLLGIKAPAFHISRYRHPFVVDLQKVALFDGALTTWRSLKFYVKRFGLNVPEDPHDGADIAQLFADQNWDAIRHHVTCDVLAARALGEFLGALDARRYQEAF